MYILYILCITRRAKEDRKKSEEELLQKHTDELEELRRRLQDELEEQKLELLEVCRNTDFYNVKSSNKSYCYSKYLEMLEIFI